MQVLDADRDQQQGRRCATEPTDRRPAPRTTALRRDGERPPGRLHRQAADCLSRLTKTVEAGATFRATGDMVLNARPTFSTQLVVDEGGELFERRPVVLARFTRHGRPPGGKLPDAAAAGPAPVRAPGDPRLHGSERNPQHAGNLVVGHAVDIAENNRHPHIVLERLDAFMNQPMALAGFRVLLWVRRGDAQPDDVTGLVVLRHHAVTPAPTKVVITEVDGDLEQP